MDIEHISVSREGVWSTCQLQYKFKYHLKVVTDAPTPFYFTFGKLVHRIIEEHTKSKGQHSLSKIKSDILSGQIEFAPGEKPPSLTNESHYKLSQHLGNYMRLADKIGYEGDIEWPFYVDLDPPNGRHIKGFLDRLIIKNDRAFILDWKTTKPSRWRKDSTTITKDLQMASYCWIVQKQFGLDPRNIKAALYYLEDAKLVPVVFSQKTLDSVPERLVAVYKDIQKCDPDRAYGRVGDHCRRCDFRGICPSYRLTE